MVQLADTLAPTPPLVLVADHGVLGYWQSLGAAASVDWCEPNYVHSAYVAELWNTISSLAFNAKRPQDESVFLGRFTQALEAARFARVARPHIGLEQQQIAVGL